MKSISLYGAVMIALACAMCDRPAGTPAQPPTAGVIEIAVSQVDTTRHAEFVKVRAEAMRAVREFDGFRSWRTYRSVHQPDIFMDRLEWATTENATHAAKTMEGTELGRRYFAFIKEIKLFDHFAPDGHGVPR